MTNINRHREVCNLVIEMYEKYLKGETVEDLDNLFTVFKNVSRGNDISGVGKIILRMATTSLILLNRLQGNVSVDSAKETLSFLTDLYRRKNNDYGDSFHNLFIEEGWAMVRIRLGDKFNRYTVLSSGNKAMVKDESILDTLMDFCNYSIMSYMEIDYDKYS